jgi:hypothetical protein
MQFGSAGEGSRPGAAGVHRSESITLRKGVLLYDLGEEMIVFRLLTLSGFECKGV